MESSLDRLESKGKVTREEREAALANISFTTDMTKDRRAGLIIEAVTERLEVKRALDLVDRGRSYGSFLRTHGEPPDPDCLVRRLMVPGMLEAVRILEGGVASAEDIDRATRLGLNLPMGPLEMADDMGLGALVEAAEALYGKTGDPGFFPPPLLRRLAAAGMKLREY